MAINLRKEARNRPCQIRIPGVCKNNRETVVLAHLNNKRLFGVGMGGKVPDIFGAWACQACHDVVDGRTMWDEGESEANKLLTVQQFYEGCFRTQNILLAENKIIIP